jgi:hypothetical protein
MALELQIAILIVAGLVGSLLIGLGTYLGLKDSNNPTGVLFGLGGIGLIVFAIIVVSGWVPK